MSKHASEGDFAELALAVYVEELVAQKRVLYVGEQSKGAAERLARAARSVDVISPHARARGTRRGGRVQTRPWPGADEDVQWDVIVAPDLPGAGLTEEDRLDEVVGWLADGGILVAGAAEPEPRSGSTFGYEELFELLDGVFDSVRMLGQAPFAGWSVVDFAPASEPEVTFDGSLLEGSGERAKRYVALCGDADVVLDAYAVVQIPSATRAEAPAPARTAPADGRVAELSERLRLQQDALDAANVHAEGLERGLAEAEERAKEAKRRNGLLERKLAELDERLADATEPSFDEEYARLETALWERGRELTEARAELARRATLVRDLIEELEEARRAASSAPKATPSVPGGDGGSDGGGPRSSGDPSLQRGDEELRHALRAQVQSAVERAVSAETEKATLAFQLDEVRGELAMAGRRSAQQLEEMSRLEAALRGTVRGLNARLAEVIELYQLTQARLALVEDDRRGCEARNLELSRQLAEARERLELEIARAQMLSDASRAEAKADAPRAVEATSSEGDAELREALRRCREEGAEREQQHRQALAEARAAQPALGAIEGLRAGYQARIAELVQELDSLGGDAERALIQVGELKTRLEVKERVEATLRGELDGTRLRLEDREAAVRELTAAAARVAAPQAAEAPPAARSHDDRGDAGPVTQAGPASQGDGEGEVVTQAGPRRGVVVAGRLLAESEASTDALDEQGEDLGEALAEARREAEGLRERVRELSRSANQARSAGKDDADAAELRAAVGSRDAMIGRLQTELAQASLRWNEQRRDLERRLAECTEQSAAPSGASAEELEELTARLERSDAEHRRTAAALDEAREILLALSDELPAPGEDASGYVPARGAGGDDVRRLRERVGRLDAEAADREVLLRSLTAQLEERDDRLRALERLGNGAGGDEADAGTLRARLLEMEERVARLTEELEHERDARRRLEDRA